MKEQFNKEIKILEKKNNKTELGKETRWKAQCKALLP